jgi:superfamily II DNA or RNA helicase
LIISELRTRGWIDRVLVLTPAGLRDQWRSELHDRFGVEAVHLDAATLRRIAADLPLGINPWTTVSMAIASVDYVKRAEVLPAVRACRWDVVIVDEAHSVVGDSNRHDAVRAVTAGAPYVLLLTATPHNGDAAAYDALRRLGSLDDDPLLIFRRTRGALRQRSERRIHTLHVRQSRHERRLHTALAGYGDAVGAEAKGVPLAMSVLHKRAYSSAWALQQSVERRLAALAPDSGAATEQLTLPLGDAMGEFSTADEAPDWPKELALADPRRERHLLTAVAEACTAAVTAESKVKVLARLLRRIKDSAIVFTEYRDTLLHLRRRLSAMPVVVLHGGLTRQERAEAVHAFSNADRPTVLLATDAAGEGLNLHRQCRFVVNLELPWNPMRLEQRIGRVDRIGQTRAVHVVHLVARGTGESIILARLRSRIVRAQTAVGAADPLGGVDVDASADPEASSVSAAATAEADRLRLARAFTALQDERLVDALENAGPWIVRTADVRRLRRRIGATAALIVQSSLENQYGRRLASRLRAVLLSNVPQVQTRHGLRKLTRDLAATALDRLDDTDWADCAMRTMTRFAATRIAREKSIAAPNGHTTPRPRACSRRNKRPRRASNLFRGRRLPVR